MAILVRKSGWLILGEVVRETEGARIFKAAGCQKEIRVPKDSDVQKIVDTVDEAQKFIMGKS